MFVAEAVFKKTCLQRNVPISTEPLSLQKIVSNSLLLNNLLHLSILQVIGLMKVLENTFLLWSKVILIACIVFHL